MQKLLISLIALMTAGLLSAAPRSLGDAENAANKFLTSDATHMLRMAPGSSRLKLAHTALQADQQPAFYIFNNGDNNGFVVVSADDNAREILGYSETGSFDETNMPSNMKVWFQHYAEEVAWAAKNGVKTAKLPAAKRAYSPVAPLLKSTWDQGRPYNNLCPIDQTDNKRCYTGCVATAAAQIMRYHQHPVKGTGSHTDDWDNSGSYSNNKGKGHGSETADFGNTTYDWANMIDSYRDSYTDEQANAIATLMYHVGISCDMIYGANVVGGSGAYTSNMAKALFTYFGYDKSLEYILMDYTGYDKFEQSLLDELAAGRPILMGGATTSYEGHEFVCDGVDANGYFHINWGWSGISDNYFALTALDPDQQGAGGAASKKGYSVEVEAIINIKPDEGGSFAQPSITVEPDEHGDYDYQFSKTEASKTETITFSTQQGYNNGPVDVLNAQVGFAVYTEDMNLVQVFGSNTFSMATGDDEFHPLTVKGSFNGLAAGNYLLALAFRFDDSYEWKNIGFYGAATAFFKFEATSDKVFIGSLISQGNSGGNSQVEGNLDVNNAEFWLNGGSDWELALTNIAAGYKPCLVISFQSASNTTVSGEYSIGENAVLYESYSDWYSWEDPVTTSVSGTLKIIRRAQSRYEIWISFKGDDGNDYEVHGVFADVQAFNQFLVEITLTDPIVEAPTDIESASTNKKTVFKTLENGHIVIKLGENTYNILGTRL